MARPRKPDEEVRAKLMQVRMQLREYEKFRDAAKASGLDLSSWVRDRLQSVASQEMRKCQYQGKTK